MPPVARHCPRPPDDGARAGQRYDFRPMLAELRPLVAGADLALCHLEVPLSRDGRAVASWPSFNAPPELAAALRWAGYDACSTASNHAMDRGAGGVAATLDVLDRAGLRHDGTARDAAEAAASTVMDVRGLRIGLLSYAYGLNGGALPSGQPWLVDLIDPARIVEDARAARRAGARFVVVLLHWGQENQAAPTSSQRELARRLGISMNALGIRATTSTWSSRSSRSAASGSPTAWATPCPTRPRPAARPAPRTASWSR